MKWRNYGLWVSIASLSYMVLKDMGFQIDLTQWQTYVTGVLSILVTLGIISNPESGKGFFDPKTPPAPPKDQLTTPQDQQSIQQTDTTPLDNIADQTEVIHDRKYTPYEK